MKNLTQFKLLFIFFAVTAFLDIAIAYGEQCNSPSSETGSCNGRIHRWTYSAKFNYCFFFVYGGCGATENIFKTRGECYSACVRKRLDENS